ncbi:MAG: hypothetical protein DRO98_07725, partial [Archaeoglobales archaeon]
SVNFAVDTTPPAISFIAPTPANNSITNKSVTIAVNVTDAMSNVSTAIININGANHTMTKLGSGRAVNFSYTITGDGDYTYRAYANDSVNHWNSTETRIVTIDTVPPQITVIDNPSPVYRNATANLTVAITDLHPNRYIVYRNGTMIESSSYQNNIAFNISINTTQLGFWNYTITANDTAGNSNSTSIIVEVRNNPPIASFSFNPASPQRGQTVTFNASQSYDPDGSIVSYSWNFGDGSTASGVTVTHSYSSAGTYTVTLTITDNDGDSSSATAQIAVTSPPARRAGGGGGGGGAAFIPPPLEAPPEVKHVEARYFPANREVTFKPPSEIVKAADVVEIHVKTDEARTLSVAISKAKELPESVPTPPYKTYKIFEVVFAKYGTTAKVEPSGRVSFRVAKDWMVKEGVNEITLMKYSPAKARWMETPTTRVDEDENYVYFESNLRSFSLFAIVGKVVAKPTITTTPAVTATVAETPPPTVTPVAPSEKLTPTPPAPAQLPPMVIVFVVVAVIAAIAAVVYLTRK